MQRRYVIERGGLGVGWGVRRGRGKVEGQRGKPRELR